MIRKLIVTSATLTLAMGSSAALAGQDDRYDEGGRQGGSLEYARVLDVDPIVREVRVQVPRQECWDEARPVPGAAPMPPAGGAILGGVIGGVLGHQVGSGDGRRVATVAGALIGSAIGHNAATRSSSRYVPATETVERCETRYESRVEQRVEGYRVRYEYGGRQYRTRLPYDPGERMRVQVSVVPAGR